MLFPTPEEIKRWVSDTVRHACHIEYYLQNLKVGDKDLQRPHDIVGHGNKLEWPAIRGFAMQYQATPTNDIHETYVLPALTYHRQQDHHQCWNAYYPSASTDAMRLGAVDAVCSLLEPRGYQGGCHTWDEIWDIAEANPIHKVAWMQLMVQAMREIPVPSAPDLAAVDLDNIPKGWVTPESRDIIRERVYETRTMLHQDHDITI